MPIRFVHHWINLKHLFMRKKWTTTNPLFLRHLLKEKSESETSRSRLELLYIISNKCSFVTSKEFFCPLFFRIFHNLFWSPRFNNFPLVEEQDLICHLGNKAHIMADQNHGLTCLSCCCDGFFYLSDQFRIEG